MNNNECLSIYKMSTIIDAFSGIRSKAAIECAHFYKLKGIHYYTWNFRLFVFYSKITSICKTSTAYNPCIYVDMPLPYSLIPNTAKQFLDGNLLRNLLGILHTWNTVWFEQYSVQYCHVVYMHIFWFQNIFIT